MSEQTPRMRSALLAMINARLAEVYTGMPGIVVSYDPESKRASIQPALPRGYQLRGDRQVEKLPVINEVPILWPAFMGGVRIKGTLIPGDHVWLMFSQRSVDRWKALGGQVSDTGDDRMHSISDAFAYPGGTPGGDDGDPQIEFTVGGEIHAGGSAQLATVADLQSLLTAIINGIAAAVEGDGGAAALTSIQIELEGLLWPTGTTVLKGA